MGSSLNVSWFILGFFLVLQPNRCPMFVNGDTALEQQVCSKTTEPDFCQICFDSDPKSITEVLSGLGCISVNCTYNQAVIMHKIFTIYASSAIDKEVKELAAMCVPYFDNIKNYLPSALDSCRKGDYGDSFDRAAYVRHLSHNCTTQQLPLNKLPSELVKALVKFEALTNVVTGIMAQLPLLV